MSPPNNVVTLLKESQTIARVALMATGYLYPGAPRTKEQCCAIALCHALDVARLYTQLIEDDMYDEVLECLSQERTPRPW